MVRYVTYIPEDLPPDDRIIVLNGENPPLFMALEDIVSPKKEPVNFQNLKYLEIPYDNKSSFTIWEVLSDGQDFEYCNEISKSIEVYKRTDGSDTKLILKCDRIVEKGYIQFD